MNIKKNGFTLIELLVAIAIFAIIAVISYRILSALVTTKQVVTKAQNKWDNLARTINLINSGLNRSIPLVVRDGGGAALPSLIGKNSLSGNFDAQLEFTENGFIGDIEYGSSPPKRIGIRYNDHRIYLVTWPVLNRVITTVPRIDVLLENVADFKVSFFYPDNNWHDSWPYDNSSFVNLPAGVKIYIKITSGEEIIRQWALQ